MTMMMTRIGRAKILKLFNEGMTSETLNQMDNKTKSFDDGNDTLHSSINRDGDKKKRMHSFLNYGFDPILNYASWCDHRHGIRSNTEMIC